MIDSSLPAGRRVVVAEFADNPELAIERHLRIEAMPAPNPAELGPRDVIVAVESAAVGWVDLLMTSGQYQHMPKPPYTPGLECAGTVAWVAPEMRARLSLGARVLVDGFLAGPRSVGAYQASGAFASYVVAPAEAVIPIPGALDFDQAAGLLSSYETAYHCLITRGRLQPGEWVLIHGASGATGLAAVQVAKLAGAKVIASGRSSEKLEVVGRYGADKLLNLRGEDGGVRSFRDEVKEISGGGVHVVYDGVGGDISLESLRCVRFGARFLIVGWAATPFVAHGKGRRGSPNANQLPTNLIMMKSLDVLGCPTVISTVQDPASRQPRLRQVLEWAEQGKINPHVSHVFGIDEVQAAMRAKWSGLVVGGCVLHP